MRWLSHIFHCTVSIYQTFTISLPDYLPSPIQEMQMHYFRFLSAENNIFETKMFVALRMKLHVSYLGSNSWITKSLQRFKKERFFFFFITATSVIISVNNFIRSSGGLHLWKIYLKMFCLPIFLDSFRPLRVFKDFEHKCN